MNEDLNEKCIQKRPPQIRDFVFGVEDGMVSTLGALTGIAMGSGNQFIVILSGLVIVAVESISMGVGSYISNKAEKNFFKKTLQEEEEKALRDPEKAIEELKCLYRKDGWPEEDIEKISDSLRRNKELIIKEIKHHKLGAPSEETKSPTKSGLIMLFSYIAGGLTPVTPYFLMSIEEALPISITLTLIGLFALGALTGRFSKKSWFKSGMELMMLAGAACLVGFFIGQIASKIQI